MNNFILSAALTLSTEPPYVMRSADSASAQVFGEQYVAALAEGCAFESLLWPADHGRYLLFLAAIAQQAAGYQQVFLRLSDGMHWLLLSFEGQWNGPCATCTAQNLSFLHGDDLRPRSAAELSAWFGAGACGGVSWDLPSDEVVLSAEAAAVLGVTRAKRIFNGDECKARIHPDDHPGLTPQAFVGTAVTVPQNDSLVVQKRFRVRDDHGAYRSVQLVGVLLWEEAAQQWTKLIGTITDISLKRREAALQRKQSRLLDLVNDVQQAFLLDRSLVSACDRLFEPLLELTESELGFIGILQEPEDEARFLEVPSISNIAWDDASRAWFAAHSKEGKSLRFHSLDNLFGHVVTHNVVVCTGDIEAHPASRGQPHGHPKIHTFLGIPLRFDGRAVGMLAMANRKDGYDETIIEALKPFAAVLGTLIQTRAVEERRARAEESLLRQARQDELTGLSNRRHFFERALPLLAQAKRYQQPMALALMDIDHFKQVNDSYGHAGGDQVLKAFAGLLGGTLRGTDVFARIGGEEFAVLLPNTELDQAVRVMQRFRREVERCPVAVSDSQHIAITVSIGLCPLTMDLDGIDQWLSRADAALYQSKHHGRNCLTLADVAVL